LVFIGKPSRQSWMSDRLPICHDEAQKTSPAPSKIRQIAWMPSWK
jgi:hypothetical protein